LRFENQFEFAIEIDEQINQDQISIPTMILQTFLENAIWHGLTPKKDKGYLSLSFKLDEKYKLLITIEDDGVGREKSAEINKKRKHHEPTGINNIRERLKLLNKLNKTDMYFKIIDLYNELNQPVGTKVEIVVEI